MGLWVHDRLALMQIVTGGGDHSPRHGPVLMPAVADHLQAVGRPWFPPARETGCFVLPLGATSLSLQQLKAAFDTMDCQRYLAYHSPDPPSSSAMIKQVSGEIWGLAMQLNAHRLAEKCLGQDLYNTHQAHSNTAQHQWQCASYARMFCKLRSLHMFFSVSNTSMIAHVALYAVLAAR